jgi:quercetin dioxygenase-like cupin family protein
MPQKVVWEEMEWEPVTEQVSRKVIMGDNLMIVRYKFLAGTTWPEERHAAEQGGYILRGKVEFHSGDSMIVLGPGNSYFIESNAAHHTHFVEETELLDIFSPPRKNLMQKGQEFAPDRT